MAAVDPAQPMPVGIPGPQHRGQVQLHVERHDRLVGQPRGFLQPSAGTAGGAQRTDRQRGKRRGRVALAGRVGDDQPQAVRVAGVVKEVAADVIAGQHAPGDVGPVNAGQPRRQQVLLNLGGGLGVLAPTDGMQRVGVAGRQLQRQGGLARKCLEINRRPVASEQKAHHAIAHHHRPKRARSNAIDHQPPQLRQSLRNDLRSDADRRTDPLGKPLHIAGQAQGERPIHIQHIRRDRTARLRRRDLDDSFGHQMRQRRTQQLPSVGLCTHHHRIAT